MYSREKVGRLVESWVGKNEKDGSYKEIIDIYNSYPASKRPRGIKMDYSWAWCACTWSALAIKLGYTDIMPIEISCGYLIEQAKKMGCWQESDSYVPKNGDAVLYDWQDSGKSDNTGWPDHVGTVTYCNPSSGYFVVTEGNYSDSVKKRTVSINGRFIRGFITPKYDDEGVLLDPDDLRGKDIKTVAHEVIAGRWSDGARRKAALTEYGYDYEEVQAEVNRILNGDVPVITDGIPDQDQPVEKEVRTNCYAREHNKNVAGKYKTTEDVYLREDAGTNKKAMVVIPGGTTVESYGFYNKSGHVIWPLIVVVIDGVKYVGFCSSNYLKK